MAKKRPRRSEAEAAPDFISAQPLMATADEVAQLHGKWAQRGALYAEYLENAMAFQRLHPGAAADHHVMQARYLVDGFAP
jgi:hypothetical protein